MRIDCHPQPPQSVIVTSTVTLIRPSPLPIIVPVLSGETVLLARHVPTILTLVVSKTLSLWLMSESPYYEANLGSQVLFPICAGVCPCGLPVGAQFVSAMQVNLYRNGIAVTTAPELTVSFVLPRALWGKRFSILYWNPLTGECIELGGMVMYWDARFNFGMGAWVIESASSTAPLEFVADGRIVVKTNLVGTFILIAR